ncbi:hypothetical protein LO762_09705 [Actinocorallia sp. API 0066]|uniref:hypothetical protein n=1 Tax=Actinocorallia sp. API 0066 TaxID=2896846 RepID=UPI001E570DD1|nr:hypothetical protein [Actinocorallia sp. API 0066]MCD0449463.1 hypothetical protein [Actinocorallia sp. API 0066]
MLRTFQVECKEKSVPTGRRKRDAVREFREPPGIETARSAVERLGRADQFAQVAGEA